MGAMLRQKIVLTMVRKQGEIREKQMRCLLSRFFLRLYKARTAGAECVTRYRGSRNTVQ